jgi:MFS transporter, DHA2 family, methylenomycin A resistance protein
VGSLQWMVDGYAVALAAFMLPCGDFGDRHGHKRVVLAGLATFGLGSLGAGLAPGPGMLIAARVVQGAGAALLLPGTLAVVSRAYEEPAERARAIGIWAAISALALPAGMIAGGALVEGPGRRWAFLVNLPVIAIALPVAAAVVRETREPSGRPRAGGHGPRRRVAGHADLRAHRERPTAGVAAVALAGTFVVVERRRPDPMLPISLFRRPASPRRPGWRR